MPSLGAQPGFSALALVSFALNFSEPVSCSAASPAAGAAAAFALSGSAMAQFVSASPAVGFHRRISVVVFAFTQGQPAVSMFLTHRR